MKDHWAWQTVFYHIYPLGLCGAPERNDFSARPEPRLDRILGWLDHIQDLGANGLYLGPVFESTAHGYDTADYYHVDRRLGDDGTLKNLAREVKARGMRLILDGVFHHVGRDFWAFRDVLEHGRDSRFTGWFSGLDFNRRSPYKDPFAYEGWHGHYDLVKLNLDHPEVKGHLFEAVATWFREFDIDGLRLDAADFLDHGFLRDLASFCRGMKPDCWLMGEAVGGDYRRLANDQMLDATTNYECYKGLYSSHNDDNYFEISYSLERQFGKGGLYRDLPLYAFADNHDVNRVASSLENPAHLYPLHILLLTMPGVPSIYYGSEWGLAGKRTRTSDRELRPALDLAALSKNAPQPDLVRTIKRLMGIRKKNPALQKGDYRKLHVQKETFAFGRRLGDQEVVVAVNSTAETRRILIEPSRSGRLIDLLNPGASFARSGRKISLPLNPYWGRVLLIES